MRGTRQGWTIKLRLEGRLLCLWGLLGREVSLKAGELSLLPLTDLGPQPSEPLIRVLGPPASLCPVPVVLTVRRPGITQMPGSVTKGWMKGEPCEWSWEVGRGTGGWIRQVRTNRHSDRQTQKRKTPGKDRHTLEKTGGGPAKVAPPHPTLHFTHSPPISNGCGALSGQARPCTNYSTEGDCPRKTTVGEGVLSS